MPKSISQASQDEACSAVLFKKNIPAVPFPSSSETGSIFKAQLQVTTTEKNNTLITPFLLSKYQPTAN